VRSAASSVAVAFLDSASVAYVSAAVQNGGMSGWTVAGVVCPFVVGWRRDVMSRTNVRNAASIGEDDCPERFRLSFLDRCSAKAVAALQNVPHVVLLAMKVGESGREVRTEGNTARMLLNDWTSGLTESFHARRTDSRTKNNGTTYNRLHQIPMTLSPQQLYRPPSFTGARKEIHVQARRRPVRGAVGGQRGEWGIDPAEG